MRPSFLHVGGVLYWTIRTRNPDTQVLKDADSTPTVVVRKNGASTGDSVTVTKRSATTGIYDCSYDPAGEVEGDEFVIEESATVTGTTTPQATYSFSWAFTVIALERGTNGANTTAPDNAGIAATKTAAESADGKLTSGRLSRLDRLPDVNAGSAGGLSLVGSEMGLTSAVLGQLFSDTDTAALVNAIIARVESDLDGADLSTAAIAVAVRNEILNRALSGNHETAGTVGKVLQFLDAAISGRMAAGNVTVGGYASGQSPADSLSGTVTKVNSIDTLLTALTEVVSSVTRFKAAALSQAPSGGGGSGGLTLEQAETLDSIAVALAGSAPVEPTGTNLRDQITDLHELLLPDDPDTPTPVITPGTGDITTGWLVCLDESGSPEADVLVYARLVDVPNSETGFAHSARAQEQTSAANGLVEFSLIKGASYYVWRGRANPPQTLDPVVIPANAGSTYELPSIRAI